MIHFLLEPLIRAALEEDLGRRGDVTTLSLVEAGCLPISPVEAVIVARESGCIAGIDCVRLAFHLLDPTIELTFFKKDGQNVEKGEKIVACKGSAATILTAERVALNFLGHLSGIATQTQAFVAAVAGTKARICATRKTTPHLRLLEKEAVRAGGGLPHRFGLDDAILIKDNHIGLVGSIEKTVAAARQYAGHMLKVQVEVDTFEQLQHIVDMGVDAVLLDNMSPDQLKRCVDYVAARVTTEASGGVNIDNVRDIAEAGVDLISSGSLTHSVTSLDVALDL